jgi:hypothetical protein
MVSVWECPVVGSPSVQLWIPEKEYGGPIVKGVFHQVVEGSAGEFIGAMPSTLPMVLSETLATARRDAATAPALLTADTPSP